MELKQALEKLKKNKEYRDFIKKSNDIFFSYALIMIESRKTSSWQLGFYNKTTDRMTTFTVDNNKITSQKEEEIFKKPDMEVKLIGIEKIKIPFKKILKKAEQFQKKKYPKELIDKTIAILQNLEQYGNIWNITYVTNSFKTLNMKINAENGDLVSHNLESIMDFVKK